MTDEDLKKIKAALKEEVKPLHGELAKVKQEINELALNQIRSRSEITKLSRDLARIDSNIETLGEKADALLVDVKDLQDQTGAIWDKVSLEAEKTKREVNVIKEHLGLPQS